MILKSDIQAVRFKLRVCPSQKAKRFAEHVARLEAASMVYRNNQVPMIVTRRYELFRLVSDSRAVHANIEQATMPMPNLKALARLSAGAGILCMLDMLQGLMIDGVEQSGATVLHHGSIR